MIENNQEEVNKNLQSQVEFLNEQIDFHKKRTEAFAGNPNPFRSAKHKETAANFRDLRDFLVFIFEQLEACKQVKSKRYKPPLSLTPEDIEGLPKEQLDELSISSGDKAEFAILSMMEDHGGVMSLDQIIVGLYKETQEVQKRSTVTARLYRMSNKGIVHIIKKGTYSLEEMSEEEIEELFRRPVR